MELPKKIAREWLAERDRLPLWVPVLLAIGIGLYYALPTEPKGPWEFIGAAGAFFAIAMYRRQKAQWRLFALTGFIILVGFLAAMFRTHSVDAHALRNTLFFREVQGQIDDILDKEKGQTIILSQARIADVKPETGPPRISVSLRKPLQDAHIGDSVKVKAMLFPPPTPVSPGSYDFARGYFYDRIGATGFSPYEAEITQRGEASGLELWLRSIRLDIARRLFQNMDKENAPVAAALMVGEKSGISEEVKEATRDSGIYHILVISGLHMSLAVGLVYMTVRLLLSLYMPLALRWPVKKIAALCGLVSALAYLLLAGYPVSATRAFIMIACVMVAVLFDRRGISLYSLAWAAVLILLIWPESLLGASFQLSFAATLAIIALYERYGEALFKEGRGVTRTLAVYFVGILCTSLAATLATTPLVAFHFNRLTLWGIAANILMMPISSLWIMPSAVLTFLAMPFGLEAWPMAAFEQGVAAMIAIAKWFAALPYADIPIPSPTFWGFLMIVFGGLWLCIWQRRWRLIGVPFILIGFTTFVLYKPYDVWVSEDANKVMVRLEGGEYLFLRGRTSSFDAEAWLRMAGSESALTPAGMKKRDDAPTCTKEACVIMLHGKRIAVAQGKKKGEALCERADIVVSPDRLTGDVCAKVPVLLDQKRLDKSGAVGIHIGAGEALIDTASKHRGRRPWVAIPYENRYVNGSDQPRGNHVRD